MRDRAVPIGRGLAEEEQARGHHPFRFAREHDGGRSAAARRSACSTWTCRCWAFATASSCCARSSAARSRRAITASSGARRLRSRETTPLFEGVWPKGAKDDVWMSHGDRVTALPPGFKVSRSRANAPFAAIADEARKFYGVQFHPEVAHTPRGGALLKNFTQGIAGVKPDWTMQSFRRTHDRAHQRAGGQGPRRVRACRAASIHRLRPS